MPFTAFGIFWQNCVKALKIHDYLLVEKCVDNVNNYL